MKLIHPETTDNQVCDPYQELAIAVIKQAADDYRHLAKKLDKSPSIPEQKHIRQQMTSISQFFFGIWYQKLSGLDNGPEILKMLDLEVLGNVEGI